MASSGYARVSLNAPEDEEQPWDEGLEAEHEVADGEEGTKQEEEEAVLHLGVEPAREVWTEVWWQAIHAMCFMTGGVTFIMGTLLYFFPSFEDGAFLSALLYTIGSCGFLGVDVLELFTFVDEPWLRGNIAMSATGSFFYVVGSVGFFPTIYDWTPLIGELGFVLGSAVIGTSQLWKTNRIGRTDEDNWLSCTPRVTLGSKEAATATGVELSAGLGAWCFFFGTIMYMSLDLATWYYTCVLVIWTLGSVLFTAGAVFLAYRHMVMRV